MSVLRVPPDLKDSVPLRRSIEQLPSGVSLDVDLGGNRADWIPGAVMEFGSKAGFQSFAFANPVPDQKTREYLAKIAAKYGVHVDYSRTPKFPPRDLPKELATERAHEATEVDRGTIADLATRRAILHTFLSSSGEKYQRPFVKGTFAAFSIIGTNDWQDYASTVLQVVELDTMLAIEEKLDRIIGLLEEKGSPASDGEQMSFETN